MPKNLGRYDNDLSVPRKKDIDDLTTRVEMAEDAIATKQDTITGGASTITDNNLTANHALVSNGSGKVAVSEVTSIELGYLDGVTSNVQTQLDGKQGANDEIQGLRLTGGINSVGSMNPSVAINPAVNGAGFARLAGAIVKIYYDDYEMPISDSEIDNLFDGRLGTYINFPRPSGDFVWNNTKSYPVGAYVIDQTHVKWYKALKENTNVSPIDDTTSTWKFVNRAESGSYAGFINLDNVTICIDVTFPSSIRYENSVSLYWRTTGQNASYIKVEKYDSNAGWFQVYEKSGIGLNDTINNIYMDKDPSGAATQKRLRITLKPRTGSNWFALSQIAITGLYGGIEGTLLNRGGGTMYGDLSPYTAGGASLGTSGKPWKEIQAQNIHGNINDTTSTFSPATSRTNISSGDKLSTIFGKIAKWFSDLGSLAFKSSVVKSDLSSDVQESLNKADTALQTAPVTSVNTKTGAVVLTKSDIGLSNVDNVKQYSTSNPPPYPVTSVNGQTGAVTVDVNIPDNLVKYTAVSDVQPVDGLNADTLEGHNAAYFATTSGLSATNTQVASLNSGLSTANNNISTLQTVMANKLDKSGGTMTGPLVAKSGGDLTIAQVRNVIISTEEPSAEVGSNGDIWIRYTE